MDILIKGMEMPKDTGSITVTIYSDGSTGIWTEQEMIAGGMAIALPEHGDLCDKTFLNTMIENADWSDKEALADYIIDLVYDAEVIVEANNGTDN